jgi:hypothetical protein
VAVTPPGVTTPGDILAQLQADLHIGFAIVEDIDLEVEGIGAHGEQVGLVGAQPDQDGEERRRYRPQIRSADVELEF